MPKMQTTVVPCCAPVLEGRLAKADAEQLAAAFKAIADPARLRLLSFIAAQPSGEACVCYLTEPLGLSQPTVSHHLKLLFDAGLLERERRGTWVYYRIVPAELAALRSALAPPAAAPRRRKRAG
jgi:ArsR family transcriptional regulator